MLNNIANTSLYTNTNFYNVRQNNVKTQNYVAEEEHNNNVDYNYSQGLWQSNFKSEYNLRNSEIINKYNTFLAKNCY